MDETEIDVSKYFKTFRDVYGFIYAIETVGDERELIKEIRKQNEQLQQLEVENAELRKLNKANADNYVRWRDEKEEETENHIRRLLAENEELKIKNKDLINTNIGQHNFIKKQQQKLEKIKRFCINKEEARLLYGCGNSDFYEIVKVIESKE